jgi:CheY-like chemotaxis protein
MQVLLQSQGHDVSLAESGLAGIAAIKSQVFDLAIVDLFMPGMNGLKVMEIIRRVNPEMPLIAASGFMFNGDCPPMPGFEDMAAEAGAILTLYKPFRPADVVRAIEQATRTPIRAAS